MGIYRKLVDRLWRMSGKGIFVDRESISLDEMYERYYADSDLDRDEVCRCLRFVAGEMALPLDRLRPTDRFMVELGPIADTWDSGYGLVMHTVWKAARKRGVKMPRVDSIDEFVRACCALECT